MTYLGLYALQHRGQESAGIAASDLQQVRISRAMGYVADTFDGPALAELPGSIAIGHVRYSTAGESKLLNAQPILIDCAHGQIAICHNGNLVNARELRDELVRQGSIFQSNSDTEVILHLYARSKARYVDDAIVESVSQAQGAFSLVMLTKDRLVAIRDPHGVHVSGATVHLVTSELDGGPIIVQAAVPVLADDTVDTLSARILLEEHRIYPEAIQLVLDGGWSIEGRRFVRRMRS